MQAEGIRGGFGEGFGGIRGDSGGFGVLAQAIQPVTIAREPVKRGISLSKAHMLRRPNLQVL